MREGAGLLASCTELCPMPRKISRRALGRAALAAGVGLAAAKAPAQDPVSELQQQLAKPFDEASKPLVPDAVKAVHDAAAARKKHPLPENSEPCTLYAPSPKGAR